MGKAGKIGLALVVLVLVAAGAAYYFFGGLLNAGIDDYAIQGISGIDAKGFTLNSELRIRNPSNASLTFDYLEYKVVVLPLNQIIGEGVQRGLRVPANGTHAVPLPLRVEWTPSKEEVAELSTHAQVNIEVRGTLSLAGANWRFSDIHDVKQFIASQAR